MLTYLLMGAAAVAVLVGLRFVFAKGDGTSPARPAEVDLDTRIHQLWVWFGTNAKKIRMEGIGTYAAEIGERIARVHPELVWEIAPRSEDFADWDFVVSADGRVEHFPLVQQVVAAAPDVPGWEILAFRQPGPDGLSIETPTGKLDSKDIWFQATPAGAQLDITLFVPDPSLADAAVILLDNCVGEYDAVTRIHTLECEPLPDDPEEAGLRRLAELRGVFAELKTRDH